MHRYYKISREWTEKLGETETAPRHPDGMHLVMPVMGHRIAEILQRETGGMRLTAEEALEAIGAIGMTVAEAHASRKGELRHDGPGSDTAQKPDPSDFQDTSCDTDNQETE